MDQAALREYFSQPTLNPTSGSNSGLEFPGALSSQQYRYLGLCAEIKMAEKAEIPNLELAKLYDKRAALEVVITKLKKQALPDYEAYKHPQLPDGWREEYERLMFEFPRKAQAEMSHNSTGQTGESTKKKPRKGRKISPKPVKIQG